MISPAATPRTGDGAHGATAPEARARAWLRAMGPAVQGQGGDAKTFRAAATLLRDFGLPWGPALDALREWNATCSPPWTDRDLVSKLKHAARYARGGVGSKLAESRAPSVFRSGREAVDALLAELGAPLDPDATARDLAALGVIAERGTVANEISDRRRTLGWLLPEVVRALRFQRRRKGGPDPAKIHNTEHQPDGSKRPVPAREAAILLAAASFMGLDPAERLRCGDPEVWILEQAVREHFFNCDHKEHETQADEDAVAARAVPSDGRVRPEGEPRGEAHPLAVSPERPDVRRDRAEAAGVLAGKLAAFRASLSPLELEILAAEGDGQSAEGNERVQPSEADLAARVGTTRKTVHSARGRVRRKVRSAAVGVAGWERESAGPVLHDAGLWSRVEINRNERATMTDTNMTITTDHNDLPIRPMRPHEIADYSAGGIDRAQNRAGAASQARLAQLHGPAWVANPCLENRWQGPDGVRRKEAEEAAATGRHERLAAQGPVSIKGLRFHGHGASESWIEGTYANRIEALTALESLRKDRDPLVMYAIGRTRALPKALAAANGVPPAATNEQIPTEGLAA